jgi:hypothetical protein
MEAVLAAYPETCVLFTLATVVLLVVSLLKVDYFFPPVLYFLVQTLMLGVAYLKLDPAMTDFHLNTWLVWGGGMVAFIGGSILTQIIWATKGGSAMPSQITLNREYSWPTHFCASFLAFAYFFIGVIGVISVAGNFVLLTEQPAYWVSGRSSPVLKYSDFFTSGAMVVGLFGVASFKSINPVRWVRNASRFMVVFTMILSFMTFPSRGINMLCIGFLLMLYNYLHGRFTWKTSGVILAFALAFFIGVAFLKGQYNDWNSFMAVNKKTQDFTEKVARKLTQLPYLYISNNYWNLDYAFNRPSDAYEHEWTYGIDAFYGVTHLLRMGDGLQDSFGWDTPFNQSVSKKVHLNTIPYLWDAYKDFGVVGLFFEPFLFGILITWCYRRMASSKTPIFLLFECMFVLWIFLWSFTTGYKQSMYWAWMTFFVIVCSMSSGKGVLPFNRLPVNVIPEKDDCDDNVSGQGEDRNVTVG